MTRETPHRMTLYLKLHAPPTHAEDYHLQAEVFKDKWKQLKTLPFPWSITLVSDKDCLTLVIHITLTLIFYGDIKEDLVLSESSLGNTHTSDRLVQLVGVFFGTTYRRGQPVGFLLSKIDDPKNLRTNT